MTNNIKITGEKEIQILEIGIAGPSGATGPQGIAGTNADNIFQANGSDRAELDLNSNEDFRVKVSPNGSTWYDSAIINKNNGNIHIKQGLSFDGGINTLSKYEEGAWTPTLYGSTTSGTPTYTKQEGVYTKIGNIVFITCQLIWSNLGGAVGSIYVGGLPFNIKAGNEHRAPISISWYNSLTMASGVTTLGGFGQPNSNYIKLWGADTPRNDSNNLLNETELSSSGEVYFSMTYFTE